MIKYGNKFYRNMQEQVAQNTEDIEDIQKKIDTVAAIKFYHKATITFDTDKVLDLHFYHYKTLALTKDEFIAYIKKVKNINVDFNGVKLTGGLIPCSINWPIATDDTLEVNSIYNDDGNLDFDTTELSSEDWSFEDTIIEI